MKTLEIADQDSITKKITDSFLTIVDLFCGKYLFLTLMINLAIVTKPVVTAISVTTGMYMYYTADTSVIGNRPCRFFGMLSVIFPDKYLFMNVFKIMYFIALVLITLVVFQFVKRITDHSRKLWTMFIIDIPAALFFYCTCRPLLSLTMMYALIAVSLALYILLYGNDGLVYLTPLLGAVAVMIDTRTVYLCVLIPALIIAKKLRNEKNIRFISYIMIGISMTIFVVSAIVTNDNKNSEEVKKYFETNYNENYDIPDNYIDEDTGITYMSNSNSVLLPEGAFKVTAIDLVTEWIPNIADTIVSFTFEDIFQDICYIYIPLIAIYNQLAVPKEDKRKVAEGK